MENMAAYMIVFAEITDREAFMRDYAMPTAELIARFGGKYILRAPGVECLEGELFEGQSAVISEWPDKAAIRAFWESPEYAALKAKRRAVSRAHVMMVEAPQ